MTVKIIGIGGAPGSGKRALAYALRDFYDADRCLILSLDDYYRNLKTFVPRAGEKLNFDNPYHPDNINCYLLVLQIMTLKYLEFKPVFIVTGSFLFHFDELVELCDTTVFMRELPTMSDRQRLIRDIKEDGFDKAMFMRSLFEQYVRPGIDWAHLTIDKKQSPDIRPVTAHLDFNNDVYESSSEEYDSEEEIPVAASALGNRFFQPIQATPPRESTSAMAENQTDTNLPDADKSEEIDPEELVQQLAFRKRREATRAMRNLLNDSSIGDNTFKL